MKTPDIPENETERLQAIERIDILDTPPEDPFDDLTRLAAILCKTLFSTVSIIDEERQWFKSIQGPLESRETSRDISFCGHTLNSTDLFIIEDAINDERFADNPLVQNGPKIRFYAGAPIILDDGIIAGALCVFDPEPKTLSEEQKEGLTLLARQVTERLKSRTADAIANNLEPILALGKTNLIVFDPVQERVNYISPALHQRLAKPTELNTRPLFAQLFPDIEYDRFFSRERLNDSDLAHRKVTKICLPEKAPGKAELRLFKTGEDDRNICILGLRDRTELSRTRETAEQAQSDLRVFQQLARQSKSSFVVTDVTGKIQWVNSSFEAITEYTLSEVKGKKPGEVLQGSGTSQLDRDRISRHLRAKQPVVQEILNYSKSGRPYWIELYIEPIRDEAGSVTHFVATQKDITQRRQEHLVLKQSRANAEQANRAKSQFLAKISHELRTPLNGIVGITEKLLQEVPPTLKDSAVTLDQSSQHLMAVLDNLLDLSHIQSGALELEHESFSVVDMLEEVRQLFAPRAEMVGARVSLYTAPDLPVWVKGDVVRLKQVLMNLVSNAVKFTHQGEINISASCERNDPENNGCSTLLRFSVSDEGPGIAPEDQLRIFENFEQLDNSATRTHGGSGLGLAISKQLVEAMQGVLSLKSEPGKGSTFFFDIPLSKSEGKAEPLDAPDEILGQKPLDYALVVDDNPVNCRVLQELLTRFGCGTVQVAQSARRGMAILDNVQPDVVFIDIQMPDMSGFELMSLLRQRFPEQNRPLPITVACTAEVSDSKRKECLAKGFDAHLGKPVTGASLHDLMNQLGLKATPVKKAEPDTVDAKAESASETNQKAEMVDRESLMASFLGNEDLLKDFLSLMVENLPVHCQRVQEALQTGTVTSHSEAAHSIKGLVGYFSGGALLKDSQELETAMELGDTRKAKTLFDRLEKNLDALLIEAQTLTNELGAR
ncbi:ATP-binding protein [Marinobacter sp. CHS3-4]|uniref:ATP-binding protein n=1 Tax=Marinobacter sp. CHS3-4 TaxID=3045174 RepID=UPI0024B5D014|nr:ATP-binding protein [Marinobacter sp. CHS3-4]MDI9245619.1 ATP-binding protein [Marinobacter sp. CHS3-4]